MEQRFCVSIVIGELFSGVSSKDGKNKTKPASVLQQEVRDKFVGITSIEVSSHKFKSLVTNYVKKIKRIMAESLRVKFLVAGFRHMCTCMLKMNW